MISFPNAKINIGLNILSKRDDGYHNLQTIFYPVAIKDALEIIDTNESENDIVFSSSGLTINGKEDDNLCIKAYHLLQKDFQQILPVKIHLHKNIPMGAGMGGGSADAAFMLCLLNDKFSLNLSTEELIKYALQLGSDCPFFIVNQPCFATGRGEILEPIKLNISPYKICIVNPGIHVNTAIAFSGIEPGKNECNLIQLIHQPIKDWKETIINDFEVSVFAKHPEIASIKHELYKQGALYASMSGSGSTVYGIFKAEHQFDIKFPSGYFFRWV